MRQLGPSRREARHAHIEGLASGVGHYVFQGLALSGAAATDVELPPDQEDSETPGLEADDLKKLGVVVRAAPQALIVVFTSHMAELVSAAITPANSYTSKETHATVEELKAQVAAAHQRSITGRAG